MTSTGRNLTPYGGLLPVITMLEKLGFQPLLEQTLTSKRIPRAMDLYRFVPCIALGRYIGFPRLNQLRFVARDPILTGILNVVNLPVQSTFWRFLNALHRNVVRQILTIMRVMRERVWEAANPDDAHRPLEKIHNLAATLSHVETRQVRNDYTLRSDGKLYQIERQAVVTGLRGANVRVEQRLDGSLAVRYGERYSQCGSVPWPTTPPRRR